MPAARVTNRTNYALRAVLYLSLQDAGRVVPISEVAHETGLSVKFLEEILLLLRTAGIVQSRRGKQGGYMLMRPPHELTVADVVASLEGDHSPEEADSEGKVWSPYECVSEQTFRQAADAWWERLSAIRLSDLAGEVQRRIQERAGADMFHI
jgi:Rrf2 family protein